MERKGEREGLSGPPWQVTGSGALAARPASESDDLIDQGGGDDDDEHDDDDGGDDDAFADAATDESEPSDEAEELNEDGASGDDPEDALDDDSERDARQTLKELWLEAIEESTEVASALLRPLVPQVSVAVPLPLSYLQ